MKLDVKNWKTAPGDAHVHLILDDKPYKPIYDPKAPVKLSELTGRRRARRRAARPRRVPQPREPREREDEGRARVTEFWVGKKGEKAQDPTKPMLVYSRPKGEYKGDMANHVLVDFQLVNDKLAPSGRTTCTSP